MRHLLALVMALVVVGTATRGPAIAAPNWGLVADDGQFLGYFNCQSIGAPFGPYGSHLSAKSIWNQFGRYGSQFSELSPYNEFTSTPPHFVDSSGNFVEYVTRNSFVGKAHITPNAVEVEPMDACSNDEGYRGT